jgi:hypothetical protein
LKENWNKKKVKQKTLNKNNLHFFFFIFTAIMKIWNINYLI